jgi:hypothetical protein
MYRFLPLLLLSSAACIGDDPGVVYQPRDTSWEGDNTPPVIEHEPIDSTQVYGERVPLSATVTDEGGEVFVVQVFYRQETSSMWEDAPLVDMEGDGVYEGAIPGSDVMTGGMYYYLYAMDTSENETFDPAEGEDDAFHFRISPE